MRGKALSVFTDLYAEPSTTVLAKIRRAEGVASEALTPDAARTSPVGFAKLRRGALQDGLSVATMDVCTGRWLDGGRPEAIAILISRGRDPVFQPADALASPSRAPRPGCPGDRFVAQSGLRPARSMSKARHQYGTFPLHKPNHRPFTFVHTPIG